MKTTIEMAGKAFETPGVEPAFRNGFWTVTSEELERFADLVRADERKKWEDQTDVEIHEAILDEREACAKVCESMRTYVDRHNAVIQSSATDCAEAIRARGNS